MKRIVAIGALTVGVAATAAVVSGGEDPYELTFPLPNAAGVSSGSPVSIGGVQVGSVELDPTQDSVHVTLKLDKEHGPLGRGTRVRVIAKNVLGQKEVQLAPAAGDGPAPSGYRVPADNVEIATDLDQLLTTLDPDVRARLAVLLNESGMAFAGRRVDFRTLLEDLGPALASGSDFLGRLTDDNTTLVRLVETSDRFIGEMAKERARITSTLDQAGRVTEAVAERRGELRQTLRGAPGTLVAARGFLTELERAASPLGATARRLTESAEPLKASLDQLEPFTKAAKPTLSAAVEVAPKLLAFTKRTTPSLRGARPALRSVQTMSLTELPGVGEALDRSVDNLVATIDNWAHAIQFSDGASHVFRGEASLAPSTYQRVLSNLGAVFEPKRTSRRSKAKKGPAGERAPSPSRAPAESTPARTPRPPVIDDAIGAIDGVLDSLGAGRPLEQVEGLLGGRAPKTSPEAGRGTTENLLDFLLGN